MTDPDQTPATEQWPPYPGEIDPATGRRRMDRWPGRRERRVINRALHRKQTPDPQAVAEARALDEATSNAPSREEIDKAQEALEARLAELRDRMNRRTGA
ncbi:hypothetical protein [Actinomycetospora flava]|uniref:Uncharacterized protein n=1 Tax=Actinomycetospora flava TaxID=3129232 RepID=A0ABU8MFH4_9PSEU